MAQKVQILLTDDLDGSEANSTVRFGLDGTDYEIDLSDSNESALRDALAGYVGAARKVSRSGKPFRRVATGPDPKAVRAWAESNGIDCPPRGRIPRAVVEKFEAAH
jgi:hypothetical protein